MTPDPTPPRQYVNHHLRMAHYTLALHKITETYPPDTEAGKIAADVLGKYPGRFDHVRLDGEA